MEFSLAALSRDNLFELLVFFFLIGLPILRSIIEKVRGGSPTLAPKPSSRSAPEQKPTGLEAWERLLRGEPLDSYEEDDDEFELVDEPAPRPAARVEPRTRPLDRLEPSPVYGAEGAPLTSIESFSDVSSDPSLPMTPLSASEVGSRIPASQAGVPFAAFESTAEVMGPVGGRLSKGFASLQDRTEVPASLRGGLRSTRGLDWRLAIRTREILGAPVALRSGPADIPGLR